MQGGFDSFGKMLMMLGGILLLVGAVWHFGGKIINLGRLPGDINIQREGFSFHFPIVTSILISIILTIIFSILHRK